MKKHILIVGYENIRYCLADKLREDGHHINIVYSGMHALEYVLESEPAVIICCRNDPPFLSASGLRDELRDHGLSTPMIVLNQNQEYAVHARETDQAMCASITILLAA
ncbi:hypothetical protein HON52_03160 [Candidatus Uhrbacteria bacterium]|nr:hypothetical protein [Candidatus Uhrbacteria bacterium]